MNISKLKKSNLLVLEVVDTKVVWFIDTVEDVTEAIAKIPEGVDIVLMHPAKPFANADEVEQWELASQSLKKDKNIVLIFSSGEYRVKDVHMKGSSLDPMVHFVLQTPEGSLGFFQKEPGDSFIKQYSPLDVLVAKGSSVAGVQLDLEPFYVVLPEITEEYKQKSGINDIKEVDHINIKKISQEDRSITVSMSVVAIN